jgi:DNA-directed RNA polymerase II subunit RPB1
MLSRLREEKRSLTEDEIRRILAFIKLNRMIPPEVRQNHFENHAKQLRGIRIVPSKMPGLCQRIAQNYFKAQIEPGRNGGTLASGSMGEKNTQNTLSSFHTAGQNKVDLLVGIPRFEEVIGVSRSIKTPSMEVRFALPKEKLKDLDFVKRTAQEVFQYRELYDLLEDYNLAQGREVTEEDKPWYDLHDAFIGSDYQACEWSVRLVFDVALLYSFQSHLTDLAEIIHSNYADAFCVCSPDSLGIIDVYISTDHMGDVEDIVASIKKTRRRGKKTAKKFPQKKAAKKATEAKDADEESEEAEDAPEERDDSDDLVMLITDENKEFYFIRDLVVPSLSGLQVGGIKNILKCIPQQEKDGTWIILTKGSNLYEMMRHPLVEPESTKSNHLWDIFEVLGIEATKAFIITELQKLVSVDYRHCSLMAHVMTRTGRPTPVSRYGIDRNEVGFVAKASFEQAFNNFFEAASKAEKDPGKGASFSITMGNVPGFGSGGFKLMDDESEKPIDEEQLVYNFLRAFSASVPPPMNRPKQPYKSATPASAPSTESGAFVTEVQPIARKRTSALNAKVRAPVYTPDLSKGIPSKPTVTRLVVGSVQAATARDKFSHTELDRLGRPSVSVFSTPGGKVVENEAQNDEVY